jgi:hypothetical protein
MMAPPQLRWGGEVRPKFEDGAFGLLGVDGEGELGRLGAE